MFMKKGKVSAVMATILALGLAISGCGTETGQQAAGGSGASAQASDKVMIGTLWPLSGGSANWGNDNLNGAKLAVELVNEKGGVLGKQVELKNADNASDPAKAASEAERLIQDGAKVIVGTVISSGALPASQVAEKNKVVYLEADAVTDDMTNRGFKYTFRLNSTASDNGKAAVEFTKNVLAPKLGIAPADLKIVISHEDSAYGTSVGDAAEKALAENGMSAIARERYSAKATDLSSLVLKLKNANPDILLNVGYTPDQVLFWKQAKQYDLNLKALVGMAGWTLQATGDGLGDLVNGIFDASAPVGINTDGLAPEVKELHDTFVKKYTETYNATPSLSSFEGFGAMYLLLNDIIPKAGSLEPDKLREAALSLDIPEGGTVLGWGVKFNSETGQNDRAFATVMQWQENKVETVFPEKFATKEPSMVPLPTWSSR